MCFVHDCVMGRVYLFIGVRPWSKRTGCLHALGIAIAELFCVQIVDSLRIYSDVHIHSVKGATVQYKVPVHVPWRTAARR